MPTPKLQPSRAIQVLPSDDANLPTPNVLISGFTTSAVTNQLIDTNASFIVTTPTGVQYKVNPGDVVYITSIPTTVTIVEVVNATTLLLNVNLGTGGPENYTIYQNGSQTGLFNQGAVLYVGNAGDLKVTTSGNDIVLFAGVPAGTFIPVNVIKVWSSETIASSILALW